MSCNGQTTFCSGCDAKYVIPVFCPITWMLMALLLGLSFTWGHYVGKHCAQAEAVKPADLVWKVTVYNNDHKPVETYYCGDSLSCNGGYVSVKDDKGTIQTIIEGDGKVIASRLTEAEAKDCEQNKGQIKVK